MNTLLSIIVPTFNAGHQLANCLDSIVCQTMPNIEVLVMDGKSTDDTVKIATHYAARFPQIRVLSEPDAGIYDAMNKGVEKASGEWVYFLGSDDELYDAGTLSRIAYLFEGSADFVHGNILRGTTGKVEGGPVGDAGIFQVTICHQAIFYRRRLFDKLGTFNLAYKVCADWDFNIRCFGSGCMTHYVDAVICRYDGGGFSSKTTDHIFLQNKLQAIAQAYKISLWNSRFQVCRHEIFYAAEQARIAGRHGQAAWLWMIYGYHGLRAGQALSRYVGRFNPMRKTRL